MLKAKGEKEFQIDDAWVSAGQPSEARIAEVVAEGAVVVSLRAESEDPFDEPGLVKKLGGTFHRLETSPASFGDSSWEAKLTALVSSLRAESKGVYFHCGSANRTGTAWALLEYRQGRQSSAESAIVEGKRCGMTKLEPKLRALLSE